MKKEIIAIFMLLLISNIAAQEATNIVSPGIKPGNMFYFLDRGIEKMQLGIAGQGLPKARIYMLFAEERLAEAQALANKNKFDKIPELAQEYENDVALANQHVEKAEGIGQDVKQIMKDMDASTDKHIIVLQLVLAKAPDSAKDTLQRVLDDATAKSATLKEKNKKAGIGSIITGAGVTLTPEELAKKEEELRKREEELQKREDAMKGGGLPIITGFATGSQQVDLLKQRMGVLFIVMIVGTYLYFYYISKKRHKELLMKYKK